MKIEIKRTSKLPKCTIGELRIDGEIECFTLEDTVREVKGQPVASWKIPGVTAIPAGTYTVAITMSNRFRRMLPILLGVPGYDGVRIHPGNKAEDTEGCILVGTGKLATSIINSRIAFDALFAKIQKAAESHERVTLTIGD